MAEGLVPIGVVACFRHGIDPCTHVRSSACLGPHRQLYWLRGDDPIPRIANPSVVDSQVDWALSQGLDPLDPYPQ